MRTARCNRRLQQHLPVQGGSREIFLSTDTHGLDSFAGSDPSHCIFSCHYLYGRFRSPNSRLGPVTGCHVTLAENGASLREIQGDLRTNGSRPQETEPVVRCCRAKVFGSRNCSSWQDHYCFDETRTSNPHDTNAIDVYGPGISGRIFRTIQVCSNQVFAARTRARGHQSQAQIPGCNTPEQDRRS